jgi:A/G-specific adenine glycosylase
MQDVISATPGYEIAALLLQWFARHQRSLPWRQKHTPYATWIAEIMLQQTQVKTVLPYYQRWMQRFPGVKHVARASEDELLKHWEGLGYYARVKNIRRTAQILVRDWGGKFPQDQQELLRLPGIGAYTAGAIMSLAFNRPYAAVDGNIERVFARLFDLATPVKEKANQGFIWSKAQALIPEGQARSFNQALMELGALVCLPRNPECAQCPLESFCISRQLRIVDQRPVPGAPPEILQRTAALGVLVKDGHVLVQKRPPSGLMAGLWEFPGGKLEPGESPEKAVVREFQEELGLQIQPIKKIAVIKHSYTTFRITLHCFLCLQHDENQQPTPRAAVAARWVSPQQLSQFAFPAANGKLLRILEQNGVLATIK